MRECSNCKSSYIDYGQRSSLCKNCRRAYDREFYHKKSVDQKERKLQLQKDLIQSKITWVNEIKQSSGCVDCKNTDYRVLEFDHLPEFKKFSNVSDLVMRGYSRSKIQLEIDKCEVVCANCHRIRTYERRAMSEKEETNYKRQKRISKAILETEPEINEVAPSKAHQALADFEKDTSTDNTRITNPVDPEDVPLEEPEQV